MKQFFGLNRNAEFRFRPRTLSIVERNVGVLQKFGSEFLMTSSQRCQRAGPAGSFSWKHLENNAFLYSCSLIMNNGHELWKFGKEDNELTETTSNQGENNSACLFLLMKCRGKFFPTHNVQGKPGKATLHLGRFPAFFKKTRSEIRRDASKNPFLLVSDAVSQILEATEPWWWHSG